MFPTKWEVSGSLWQFYAAHGDSEPDPSHHLSDLLWSTRQSGEARGEARYSVGSSSSFVLEPAVFPFVLDIKKGLVIVIFTKVWLGVFVLLVIQPFWKNEENKVLDPEQTILKNAVYNYTDLLNSLKVALRSNCIRVLSQKKTERSFVNRQICVALRWLAIYH